MIKRIKKITQIGSFYDCKDIAAYDFGKVTIILGQNTYGKSTLADVFASIASADPVLINNRLSIPTDLNKSQFVELSIGDSVGTETTITFDKSWNKNNLFHKIFVFDSNFIHKNLISGIDVTRNNKESFTDFVLGEEGVKLSEEISNKKQMLAKSKNDLKDLVPQFVRGRSDENIMKFVSYRVSETKDELNNQREQSQTEKKNYDNIIGILDLPEIKEVNVNSLDTLRTTISKINKILLLKFSNFTDEVAESFRAHIQSHTQDDNTTENWIKSGYKNQLKADKKYCPFCGQSLENIESLLSTYNDFFNEKYNEYVSNEVIEPLNEQEQVIREFSLRWLISTMQKVQLDLNKYHEYDSGIQLNEDITIIEEKITQFEELYANFSREILDSTSKKKLSPNNSADEKSISQEIIEIITDIENWVTIMNNKIIENKKKGESLKTKYSDLMKDQINRRKEEVQKKIDLLTAKIARLEQEDACCSYLEAITHIQSAQKEINALTEKLEKEQSDYLKKYFVDLNGYFNRLGSSDFELKRESSERGYKKVYYLDVYYKKKSINTECLNRVFSESDKRSLALAIFLAKINQLDNKLENIIVLDDPVVSFDENRMKVSADIISELSNTHCQVILLTHFRSFVGKLYESKIEGKYYSMVKTADTTTYKDFNPKSIIQSEWERAFDKIWSYISRLHTDDIAPDCRIYLEKYLEFRYKKLIAENNLDYSNLAELLSALKNSNIVTNDQFQKLEIYRKGLNGEHHEFSFGDNTEDNISHAKDILDYLYKL